MNGSFISHVGQQVEFEKPNVFSRVWGEDTSLEVVPLVELAHDVKPRLA
jgi:hypothetical protein